AAHASRASPRRFRGMERRAGGSHAGCQLLAYSRCRGQPVGPAVAPQGRAELKAPMGKSKKSGAAAAPTFPAPWLEAAAERERAVVGQAGEGGEGLVGGWVAGKNEGAVAEIAADEGAPRPARKAARRGLGWLKPRGVKPPERAPRTARLGAEPETQEAWF